MNLPAIFKLRTKATPALIQLLESVTLGTNGAKYCHLDTRNRVEEADNPLHLTMERNDRVIGNVTFCRRDSAWYIRYFAFNTGLQGNAKRKSSGGGVLKSGLNQFFQEVLNGKSEFDTVDGFYAYIDPNNEKSLWMSETFGLQTTGHIATQTFSRTSINKTSRVERIDDWNVVSSMMRKEFSDYRHYFEAQLQKGPYYILKNEEGEIIACAKTTQATWVIERLPGKMGGLLTKVIPYVPLVRKVIRPKKHRFVVPEAVVVRNNDPKLLNELFEGILEKEKVNLLIWWVDERDNLYKRIKSNMQWGILHKLIGVNQAAIVERTSQGASNNDSTPVYTCGFDFV